jgi:TetR/AcrR family transcriptional regulator, transcriptional repressor for nem operon
MAKVSVREKIVAAGAQCFHALGYNACGVQEIVDAACVPKGSFYNHFKAKELLAREVLSNYWASARLDILADKSIAPLERLRVHFEHIAARYKRAGFQRGCLVTKFINEVSELTPQLQSDLESELRRWVALVAEAIRDGQADASISTAVNADQAARFLIDGWAGATGAMKLAASRGPLDDFLSVIFGIVLRADAPKKQRNAQA